MKTPQHILDRRRLLKKASHKLRSGLQRSPVAPIHYVVNGNSYLWNMLYSEDHDRRSGLELLRYPDSLYSKCLKHTFSAPEVNRYKYGNVTIEGNPGKFESVFVGWKKLWGNF